jgi:hypothetical protein
VIDPAPGMPEQYTPGLTERELTDGDWLLLLQLLPAVQLEPSLTDAGTHIPKVLQAVCAGVVRQGELLPKMQGLIEL